MGFKHKKSLGQNFLKDNSIVKKIVDSAEIDNNCFVIEIGPGQGVMSKLMVMKAKYLLLYEIDVRLNEYLNNSLSGYNNYKVIYNDFLKEDVVKELNNYKYDKLLIVSNLPYYITTPIVEKLINDDILPDKMVLMVQKEVAMRYSARINSKDYSSLTVLINYYYDVEKLFDVSRNSFVPKPSVDSAVICMIKKKNRLYVKDINFFKKLLKDSFRFKRKTIKNNLCNYDLDVVLSVLKKYNMDLSFRAENLSLDIFVDLSNELM